ncbi:MAG: M1 family metallopeptidase [Gemmatimonadota bacterium]
MAEPAPIQPGQAPETGPYAPGVDVLDYQVELDLREDSDEIRGKARIQLVRTDGSRERVVFDLTGLAVDSVAVGPRVYRGMEPVPSEVYRDSLSAGHLPVPFPDDSEEGDTLAVMVHYRGAPDDGLIIGTTPHGTPSAFADNWPDRARYWFPSVDHPSDKATATFIVRAPESWQVISNGAPLSPPTPVADTARARGGDEPRPPRRLTWRWGTEAPIPTYTMVVGATSFSSETVGLAACGQAPLSPRRDGCIEVTTWLFPPDTTRAAPSFRRAARMVDFFTDLIGPFPFEKLAHVQAATRFGGMENSSAIFYPGQVLADGENIEETVAHETAHQWFGDSVTEVDWHHLWLSEGFAEYFQALFTEEADGDDAFRRDMETKRREYLASGASTTPIIDEDQENLFALINANNYVKAAWVLHMLRGVLGDDVFFRGIREYYDRHAYGTVLTEDFRAAIEDVADRELAWFFDQWLRRPGHPEITTESTWDADAGLARITVRQVQLDSWPTFRLPGVIEVEVAEGPAVRREIEMTERVQEIEVELSSEPVEVRFDPDGWILTGVPEA